MIPLGILASGGGVATTPTFTLIASVNITSNQDFITFSGLPTNGTYSHYQLRGVVQHNSSSTFSDIGIRLNGATSGYYSRYFYTNGSAVGDNGFYDNNDIFRIGQSANRFTGTYFAPFVVNIMDADKTNKFKSIRSLSGDRVNTTINMAAGRWESTAAVTSIRFQQVVSEALLPGTRVSLYGVLAQ